MSGVESPRASQGRSPLVFAGPALLAAAAALLGAGVALRAVSVFLVGIVPVFTGGYAWLLGAAALFFAGMATLPLAWARRSSGPEAPPLPGASPGSSAPAGGSGESSVGGVILIGPVPILLGSYRRSANRRSYLAWALVGVALTAAAIALTLRFA